MAARGPAGILNSRITGTTRPCPKLRKERAKAAAAYTPGLWITPCSWHHVTSSKKSGRLSTATASSFLVKPSPIVRRKLSLGTAIRSAVNLPDLDLGRVSCRVQQIDGNPGVFVEDSYFEAEVEKEEESRKYFILEALVAAKRAVDRTVVQACKVFAVVILFLGLSFGLRARLAYARPPPMRAAVVASVQVAEKAEYEKLAVYGNALQQDAVPTTTVKVGKPGVDMAAPRICYSDFLDMVEGKRGVIVKTVSLERSWRARVTLFEPTANYHVIAGRSLFEKMYVESLKTVDGRWLPSQHFVVDLPMVDSGLLEKLTKKGIQVVTEPHQEGLLNRLAGLAEPLLLLGLVLLWFGGNNGGLGSMLKSKAKLYKEGKTGVSFEDVAGCDEAKEELLEVVDFLKSSERYRALGARVPRGVLLCGPAGTGKTLLAKAVAGEADVAFFSISGSEFVEIFGGLGASRVRKVFADCRKKAPAILFIDELDAIGRTRGGGGLEGAQDGYSGEREQTLNQLLTEMDGFDGASQKPVIMLGATNRPEVLDPALRRPGRFDRTVVADRPDKRGREAILKIHLKGVKINKALEVSDLAGSTVGFTGADLANLVNEAALLAARQGALEVGREHLMEAAERTMAGLARKSLKINEVERRTVAYHECGHALIGAVASTKGSTVTKISVIPRGSGALGYTLNQPDEDRYLLGEDDMRSFIATALAGRAAERLIFGRLTSGAADDLQRASEYAERMVTQYGMCPSVGPRALQPLRRSYLEEAGYIADNVKGAPETRLKVDQEIDRVLQAADHLCGDLLERNRVLLEEMAEKLLQAEVLQGEELTAFLAKAEGSDDVAHWLRTGVLLEKEVGRDRTSMLAAKDNTR